MEIQPASAHQVVNAGDRFVEIDADVGSVAADLRRIDPKLHVRFAPDAPKPFFAVYCQQDERTTYLVLTVDAHQGRTGAWTGLDQRVVREVERIGAYGYDFVAEVDAQNARALKARADHHAERMGETGQDGWALLNKLRGRNCGHMAVPGDG